MAHCLKHKGNYSDEFWMLSFKVVPCTKTYAHSWSSCPCAHPGETARRRDPTLFNYQPVLCPNVKSKSGCPSGDACGYAHNVFEQWLHPQRYKALMCTYGSQCTRPSCFFAHSLEELRVPWKGGAAGSTASGEQQQQQSLQQPQQQSQQQAGLGSTGVTGEAGEAGTGGSGADVAAAAAAAAARTTAVSVSGQQAAAGSGSGSARSRLVMQAAAGLQQQLQLQQQHAQAPGMMPSGGGGVGGGSVVDVRLVAAGSSGQSLSSDYALSAAAPHAFHPQHLQRRGPVVSGLSGFGAMAGQVQRPGSAGASAPYDLDTLTSLAADSSSVPLVSGPANQPMCAGQLYRTNSNGSTLYFGFTEEAPLASGAQSGVLTGAAPSSVSVSVSLASAAAGGTTGTGGQGFSTELALVPSESTTATSLYPTRGPTGQHSVMVTGLTPVGLYGGSGAAPGGGGAGEALGSAGAGSASVVSGAAANSGVTVPRPLPLGAPQLQQHLQQLHQHQQQMQLQQQQMQAHRPGGCGGAGGSLGKTATQQQQQHHHHHHQQQQQQQSMRPFNLQSLTGAGGGSNCLPASWQQPPGGGADCSQTGGSTASLDLTAAPQSSTIAVQSSSNLLDMWSDVDVEQAGTYPGWTCGRDTTSLVSLSQSSAQGFGQQQQQAKQQQGLSLGIVSPFTTAQRAPGAQRSFTPTMQEESAAAAVTSAAQQLQLSGPGATQSPPPAQQQQQQQQQQGPAAAGSASGHDPTTNASAATAAAAAAASGGLGGSLADGGAQSLGVFTDVARSGFRRHSGLQPSSGPDQCGPTTPTPTAAAAGPAASSSARIDPEVELLLLSSLQLQLSHAGVASHPVGASFPVRQWLRQALQGRAQAATRTYLLELLAQYMPTDQLAVVRRLVDCLEEAGTLLSCFAGTPGLAAGALTHGSSGPNAALGGGAAGLGAGPA